MSLRDHHVQFHLHSNGKGSDIHAFGTSAILSLSSSNGAWGLAKKFIDDHTDNYVFISLSYELKDDIEDLSSSNPEFIEFPAISLVVPKIVLIWEMGEIEVLQVNDSSIDIPSLKKEIRDLHLAPDFTHSEGSFENLSEKEYIQDLEVLLGHIQRGDIYEVNYCQEFRAKNVQLDPWESFRMLNEKTKAPYACHVRLHDVHLLCGSPELFIEKQGETLKSKPIKGTRKRSPNPEEDQRLIEELRNDPKERAENIMITDLVRNDFSKTALSGSVEVEELCKVYSYETVHQMISTVSSKVDDSTHPIDIIKSCFPMGSMTGAPKIRAMELIEEHEKFKRGIYSGSIGIMTPNRNFTLNVVIRSILYDQKNHLASVAAGGAITSLSNPKAEYEESLLKARAMMGVLGFDI